MAIAANDGESNKEMRATLLALYQAEGVEAELLALQDRYGASVPLLLWAAWLLTRQQRLAQLPDATAALLTWEQETVWPLRRVRRQLKAEAAADSAVAGLRAQVKASEQAAEWLLLDKLAALPLNPGDACPLVLCLKVSGAECEPLVALRQAIAARLNRPG